MFYIASTAASIQPDCQQERHNHSVLRWCGCRGRRCRVPLLPSLSLALGRSRRPALLSLESPPWRPQQFCLGLIGPKKIIKKLRTESCSIRREEKPEPVPPPNEWKTRNPCSPEHFPAIRRIWTSIWFRAQLQSHLFQGCVYLLLSDGVVSPGVVVCSILLPADHIPRMEQSTVGPIPDLVDHLFTSQCKDDLTWPSSPLVRGRQRPLSECALLFLSPQRMCWRSCHPFPSIRLPATNNFLLLKIVSRPFCSFRFASVTFIQGLCPI